MDGLTKLLWIAGSTEMCFVYAVVQPTIQLFFMQQVGPTILATSTLAATFIEICSHGSLTSEMVLNFLRRYFLELTVVDVAAFALINYYGESWPEFRFVALAVESAVGQVLWIGIMNDALQQHLSGRRLTVFGQQIMTAQNVATLIGSVMALYFADEIASYSIDYCLIAIVLSFAAMGVSDNLTVHRLTHGPHTSNAHDELN